VWAGDPNLMAEFVIKLADERGRVQEQVQTAATADELRARFAHAGYHVFSVRARSGFAGLKRRKVKLEPFLIFNQQFLTLIKAGLPILGSLQMLAKNQKNEHFSAQLDDVSTRVKTGEALSSAFEAQSGFPVMYTTTLLAGERSGNLQEVLERYVSFQRVTLTF
jgi:type IV pilus assembly protein PilC